MKKLISILLLAISSQAMAGEGPLLLGAILGDPTGLSGRVDLDSSTAFDGGLSWSNGSRRGAQLHGDYLQIRPRRLEAGDTFLDVYYGIGARLISISSDSKHEGELSLGPRAPVGLKYELRDPSVEFFGEVALILDVIPSIEADVDVGVGIRYRF